MSAENILTATAARFASIPFRLMRQKAIVPPKKALILQPCCLSQVMLVTPLLAALSDAYPNARFDWAISDWSRPAVAGNPRLVELIPTGAGSVWALSWRERWALIQRLRANEYDTVFIPSRSSLLSFIAWQAGIPQRVGIDAQGRGFAHSVAVKPPREAVHVVEIYLAMAEKMGVDLPAGERRDMEFYPPDAARTAVTRRLVDEVDWLGERPLVLLHPGGGTNPVQQDARKQWPVERFVLLGNHLAKTHNAQIIILGEEDEKEAAKAICGMMVSPAADWSGRTTLGELGALCEVADLYVGCDSGPTHIAAAQGCPTLAIFGPSLPQVSQPFSLRSPVTTLWRDLGGRRFSWDLGVSVADAVAAADALIGKHRQLETAVVDPEN